VGFIHALPRHQYELYPYVHSHALNLSLSHSTILASKLYYDNYFTSGLKGLRCHMAQRQLPPSCGRSNKGFKSWPVWFSRTL